MRTVKRILTIGLVAVAFVLLVLVINDKINQRVVVTEYTYSDRKLPDAFDGFRIMMISDLHEAPFAEQIIRHININSPDIIVFAGDMVQLPDSSLEQTKQIAQAIDDIPMYAVSGNHDAQCGEYDRVMAEVAENGIRPLEDDGTRIFKDNEMFRLIGVRDPGHDVVTHEHTDQMCAVIKNELSAKPDFSVLLCHRADLYPQMKDTGVNLILSGHMHGGVVRLPFVGGIIGGEVHDGSLFPKYDYGYIKEGNSAAMIVSGGCDKNPEKRRIFNPPEVVLITLEGA